MKISFIQKDKNQIDKIEANRDNALAKLISVSPQDLIGPRKERAIVKARILVCYWAVTELGMSRTEIGKQLGISVSTVGAAVKKGQQIVGRAGLKLLDLLNMEM